MSKCPYIEPWHCNLLEMLEHDHHNKFSLQVTSELNKIVVKQFPKDA